MASVHRGVTPEVHVPGAWKACDCAGHAEGSSNDIPHQSLFVLSSLRFFGTLPRITFFLSFSRIVEDVLRVSPAKRRFFSCIRLYLNNQRMFNFLSTNWGDSVLVTDRECPDRCKFPIYTVALFFPEPLLSLCRLYLKIQSVAVFMKYLVQSCCFDPNDQPCAWVPSGAVAPACITQPLTTCSLPPWRV